MPNPVKLVDGVAVEMGDQEAAEWRASIVQPPAEVPQSLSPSQLLIGLVTEKWITPAEGMAWRDRVALPAALAALIGTLPPEEQFAAETRALAFTEALRTDPLTLALAAAQGKTDADLDAFFTTYAAI